MLNFSPATITTSLLETTELEDLLIYLDRVYQVDLTGYKRSTLMRRISVRMQQIGVENYQDYFDYLRQQSNEICCLLDTIYINFTYFFRDPLIWSYLADQVIPETIAKKASHEPIRVWSVGCASGEETYSLAMLLIEALGVEAFQQRVQIYGTDIDSDAIAQAREGCYSAQKISLVPEAIQDRYFKQQEELYYWRSDLRDSIHFHVHHLLQDPPLSQIDLLVCRNLLIYFTSETQLQALIRLHSSLQETGFLLLGDVENLITPSERSLFTPVNRQHKVFRKIPGAKSLTSELR